MMNVPTNNWKNRCPICKTRYPKGGKRICGCHYLTVGSPVSRPTGRKHHHDPKFTKRYASGKMVARIRRRHEGLKADH